MAKLPIPQFISDSHSLTLVAIVILFDTLLRTFTFFPLGFWNPCNLSLTQLQELILENNLIYALISHDLSI